MQLKALQSPQTKKTIILSVIALVLIGIVVWARRGGSQSATSITAQAPQNLQVGNAKASTAINKELEFPLKDAKGKEVSRIKYIIEKAELRDEIIVKGQKATAVNGKTFLIISLKITNSHNQTIKINTRDYMRLSLNGNEKELLAPDIHNDAVEIQAISTKYTRLGFSINQTDKKPTLLVGEITGKKENIRLDLLN